MKERAGGRDAEGRVAGVILAAGRSTRMPGGSKLLRKFGESTVIHRLVSTALSSGLDPVIVTLRHDETGVEEVLTDLEVRFARVPESPEGRLISAFAGIAALPDEPVVAAMILLGDEPGLSPDDVRTMRSAWEANESGALRPRFRDRAGHPVVLSRDALEVISHFDRAPDPEIGLWDLVIRSGIPHMEVPIDRLAPVDVDTPTDLALAREMERH